MRRTSIHYNSLCRCLRLASGQGTLGRAIQTPKATPAHRPGTNLRRCDATRNAVPKAWYSTLLDDRIIQTRDEEIASEPALPQKTTSWESVLFGTKPPAEDTLRSAPVEVIRSALMRLASLEELPAATKDDTNVGERIHQLVHHLLTERNDPLTVFHFECMMAAMATPDGLARAVHRLFLDLEKEGIPPSARLCRHALMALAIHPDYVVRQRVLDIMEEYWFTISPVDSQFIVLGLLRDEQYELAYARLVEILEKKQEINLWMLDIFTMEFSRLGFCEEALALLIRRKHIKGSDDGMYNVLYFALDMFSHQFFHKGTLFTWNALVRNGVLNPPDGILENVLATAARYGDMKLATEAHEMIASRSRVQIHHYEAIVETSIAAGDIEGALRTLCIWEKAGFKTTRNNMRCIIDYMSDEPEAIDAAEQALRRVGLQSRLPPAAVGVVVKAIAETLGSEEAMRLYGQFKELTGKLPPLEVTQDMLKCCREASTRDQLAKEYSNRLDQGPDDSRSRSLATYGRLVAACAELNDLTLAFYFADKVASKGLAFRHVPDWLKKLTRAAFNAEDGRIWTVMDKFGEEKNKEIMNMVRMLAEESRMAKKTGEWREAAAQQS